MDRSSDGAGDPRRGGAPERKTTKDDKERKMDKTSKASLKVKKVSRPPTEPVVDLLDFSATYEEHVTVFLPRRLYI